MSNKPMKNPPSYVKVQNYILEKCKSGEYAIGSRIPSETELARMFSVSRITANKAVSELALKGILKRIRGKGSFVVSRVSAEGNTSQAFSAAVITNISEGKKHEISQFRVLTTCPELAQKLNLPANESFYEIVRKNINARSSVSWDYTYIPCSISPDLLLSFEQMKDCYIHEYLRQLPNVNPKFMKVFINTPCMSFLTPALEHFEDPSGISIWSPFVYDNDMNILAATFTLYPLSDDELPLFLFSV